jgi:hypothetical protein
MNPTALVFMLVGILMIVSGFRGHTDNIISAVTGEHYGKADLK